MMDLKTKVNLNNLKKVHFTGIKGVGMTALALCFKDLGIKISGSDIGEYFITDETLKKAGIGFNIGFSKKNILDPDLVIFTAAHNGEENIEVKQAKLKNISVMSHGEALGFLMKDKKSISVAGVGGKTTTSAMLATVFKKAGLKPSFAVGAASINKGEAPGQYKKKGSWFIAEADEYFASPQDKRPRFSFQHPKLVVLTNIAFDHPDVYKDLKSTLRAFASFLKKVPQDGLVVGFAENKNIRLLSQKLKAPFKSFGFSSQADYQIKNIKLKQEKLFFDIKTSQKTFKNFCLNIPGEFNLLNAAACFAAARFCHVSEAEVKKGLKSFKGTKRRFEFIRKVKGVRFYDDYAHHPLELKASLKAAKKHFKNSRIIALFQPHTYSRTKALFFQFSNSFTDTDLLYLAPIYASAREGKDPEASSKKLAEEIKNKGKDKVFYVETAKQFLKDYRKKFRPDDIVITLGAGDIFSWHKSFADL
jgi:UDP-N-acetylmuramate--alanine ligase